MQPEEFYEIQETLTGKKSPGYDVASRNLQRAVMESEKEQLNQGLDQYNEKETKQAIIHTRADMVLIVSYVRWITSKVQSIEIALWTIAILLAILVLKYVFWS